MVVQTTAGAASASSAAMSDQERTELAKKIIQKQIGHVEALNLIARNGGRLKFRASWLGMPTVPPLTGNKPLGDRELKNILRDARIEGMGGSVLDCLMARSIEEIRWLFERNRDGQVRSRLGAVLMPLFGVVSRLPVIAFWEGDSGVEGSVLLQDPESWQLCVVQGIESLRGAILGDPLQKEFSGINRVADALTQIARRSLHRILEPVANEVPVRVWQEGSKRCLENTLFLLQQSELAQRLCKHTSLLSGESYPAGANEERALGDLRTGLLPIIGRMQKVATQRILSYETLLGPAMEIFDDAIWRMLRVSGEISSSRLQLQPPDAELLRLGGFLQFTISATEREAFGMVRAIIEKALTNMSPDLGEVRSCVLDMAKRLEDAAESQEVDELCEGTPENATTIATLHQSCRVGAERIRLLARILRHDLDSGDERRLANSFFMVLQDAVAACRRQHESILPSLQGTELSGNVRHWFAQVDFAVGFGLSVRAVGGAVLVDRLHAWLQPRDRDRSAAAVAFEQELAAEEAAAAKGKGRGGKAKTKAKPPPKKQTKGKQSKGGAVKPQSRFAPLESLSGQADRDQNIRLSLERLGRLTSVPLEGMDSQLRQEVRDELHYQLGVLLWQSREFLGAQPLLGRAAEVDLSRRLLESCLKFLAAHVPVGSESSSVFRDDAFKRSHLLVVPLRRLVDNKSCPNLLRRCLNFYGQLVVALSNGNCCVHYPSGVISGHQPSQRLLDYLKEDSGDHQYIGPALEAVGALLRAAEGEGEWGEAQEWTSWAEQMQEEPPIEEAAVVERGGSTAAPQVILVRSVADGQRAITHALKWIDLRLVAPSTHATDRNASLVHAKNYLEQLRTGLNHPQRPELVGQFGWGGLMLARRTLKEVQVAALYHSGQCTPELRLTNSPIVLNSHLPDEVRMEGLGWLHLAHQMISYPRQGSGDTPFEQICGQIARIVQQPAGFELAEGPTRKTLMERVDREFLFPALQALLRILDRGFPVG